MNLLEVNQILSFHSLNFRKISVNLEAKKIGGLEDDFPLNNWVFFRWTTSIFRGEQQGTSADGFNTGFPFRLANNE